MMLWDWDNNKGRWFFLRFFHRAIKKTFGGDFGRYDTFMIDYILLKQQQECVGSLMYLTYLSHVLQKSKTGFIFTSCLTH